MIKETQENREIFMYCDFHGHTRAKNLFIFGCHNDFDSNNVMKERIFPLLYHKRCGSFHFDSCKFDVADSKGTTGRVTMRQKFDILNSYTLECSVCGPTDGKQEGMHFTIDSLKAMGKDFCLSLYDFSISDDKKNECVIELREMYPTVEALLK